MRNSQWLNREFLGTTCWALAFSGAFLPLAALLIEFVTRWFNFGSVANTELSLGTVLLILALSIGAMVGATFASQRENQQSRPGIAIIILAGVAVGGVVLLPGQGVYGLAGSILAAVAVGGLLLYLLWGETTDPNLKIAPRLDTRLRTIGRWLSWGALGLLLILVVFSSASNGIQTTWNSLGSQWLTLTLAAGAFLLAGLVLPQRTLAAWALLLAGIAALCLVPTAERQWLLCALLALPAAVVCVISYRYQI